MGRTLSSSNQIIIQEQQAFSNFRRALRKQHQLSLDEMFANAHKHTPAISMAGHALPFESILLAMLLEEHIENQQLHDDVDRLTQIVEILSKKVNG